MESEWAPTTVLEDWSFGLSSFLAWEQRSFRIATVTQTAAGRILTPIKTWNRVNWSWTDSTWP